MAEPDASDDVPTSGMIKDAFDDIVGPVGEVLGKVAPDAAAEQFFPIGKIGDIVGQVVPQIIGDQPGSTGATGGISRIFEDKDGDGTPDILENMLKPAVPRTEITQVRDDAKVADFLQHALAQVGDKYKRGVENSLSNDDPTSWDGSELVEWAANRAGVMVNDGPANQYRQMVRQHGDMSVDAALATPGAILYEFTGDPIKGQPTRASTAISLGDGRIIDIDPVEGVRIVDAKDFKFTHGAVMPGFTDAKEPGADALDVVHDALVQHGIEAAVPPADDTPEIVEMAQRAAELRTQYENTNFGDGRTERGEHRSDVERQQKLAEVGRDMANKEATSRQQKADERLSRADALEAQASAAEARGDLAGARELRENAVASRLAGESDSKLAEHARTEAATYQQQADAATSEVAKLDAATTARFELAGKGEEALDQLERKIELMRTANSEATAAADLEQRAADARAAGDTAGADRLSAQAQAARTRADRAEKAADAAPVDEATLQQIDDLPAHAPAESVPSTDPEAPAPDGAVQPDSSARSEPDDAPDVELLAARAAHLRQRALEEIREVAAEGEQQYIEVRKELAQADGLVEYAQLRAQGSREEAQEVQARIDQDERQAAEAEARGDSRAAEELREHAARFREVGKAREEQVVRLDAEYGKYKADAAEVQHRLDAMKAAADARIEQLNSAEDAIDALEDQVRALREVATQNKIADDLDRQAAATRAGGDPQQAQQLEAEAAAHRSAAGAAQVRFDATTVDEAALTVLESDTAAEQSSSSSPADDGDVLGTDGVPTGQPALAADLATIDHVEASLAWVDSTASDVAGDETAFAESAPAPDAADPINDDATSSFVAMNDNETSFSDVDDATDTAPEDAATWDGA